MRSFALALVASVAAAQIKLTLEEQEELYNRITGPYCDENALTDPLCVHKAMDLMREAEQNDNPWKAPVFNKTEDYCTRFPDTCESANPLEVNTKTRFLVDKYGRTTLLHGVNAIYKVDPYIPSEDEFDPDNSLNDEDIANLQKWGMNFVRLGVMWEGVERSEGKYDADYFDKVEALINKMGEAGIYTLVDAHQDVFARFMCGEGVPDFYAQKAIGEHPSCINPIADELLKDYYSSLGKCNDMNDLNYRRDENNDYLIEDCLKEMFANYYNTK